MRQTPTGCILQVMRRVLYSLLILLGIHSTILASPSFDCRQATSPAEKLVCAHSELAALDGRMALLYRPLSRCLASADAAALRESQRKWLAGREDCASAPGTEPAAELRCMKQAYTFRVAELTALGDKSCAAVTVSSSGLTTYRDKRFRFSISFPKDMQWGRGFIGHYHVSADVWRQGFDASQDQDPGFPVLAIPAYRPNGEQDYPDVEVRVGVRPGKTAEEACGRASSDDAGKPPARIGGRQFEVSDISNGGMSQFIGGESYRTFVRGYCYAIERFVTDTSLPMEGREKDKLRADRIRDSYYAKTKRIVESFRLLAD